MVTLRIPFHQRFILDNITWDRYARLLRVFSDRHLRMTYDRGILEIMTLSHEHESLARLSQSSEELIVRHCAYWHSLRGAQPTTASSSMRIVIPAVQIFSAQAIQQMFVRLSQGEKP